MQDLYDLILFDSDLETLINFYSTNKYFRNRLNNPFILNELKIKYNILQDIYTFQNLVEYIYRYWFVPYGYTNLTQNGQYKIESNGFDYYNVIVQKPYINIYNYGETKSKLSFRFQKIWIGQSFKNSMTIHEGYGPEFNGRTYCY